MFGGWAARMCATPPVSGNSVCIMLTHDARPPFHHLMISVPQTRERDKIKTRNPRHSSFPPCEHRAEWGTHSLEVGNKTQNGKGSATRPQQRFLNRNSNENLFGLWPRLVSGSGLPLI